MEIFSRSMIRFFKKISGLKNLQIIHIFQKIFILIFILL